MKKLLSILGTITLIGTVSTNVMACDTPDSQKDTKTDISNKITSSIVLGQLSTNTRADFLAKLQIALARITDLNTITTSDYDVYKAGTTTEIQDSDIIAGTSLNIKIVAKGDKFKGNKDNITTNYTQKDTRTDLKDVIKNTELGTINTLDRDVPISTMIKLAIKSKNINLSFIDDLLLNINDITATSAVVTSHESNKYFGTINVSFTSNKTLLNLKEVIKNTHLGHVTTGFKNPSPEQVITKIKELNPKVEANKIRVFVNSNMEATVTSKDANLYTGQVIVYFTPE